MTKLLDNLKEFSALAKPFQESITSCGQLTQGGYVELNSNHACHAGLYNMGGAAMIFSQIQSGGKEGQRKKFATWLVKESIYKDFILNKTVSSALNFGLAIRTDIPSNIVHSLCQASRLVSEYAGNGLPVWEGVYDATKDGNLAFVASGNLSCSGEDSFYVNKRSGHWPARLFEKDSARNFLDGNFNKPSKHLFNKMGAAEVSNLFAEEYREGELDLSQFKVGGEIIDDVPDIFPRKVKEGGGTLFKGKEHLGEFAKYMKEKIYE